MNFHLPYPRNVSVNDTCFLREYNRGWNSCLAAIQTGRDEFDRCILCSYSDGHANDCGISS